MPRPISAVIHTAALSHNLARVRRATPRSKVWAVVKANAYGHGIARAYGALRTADGFALLDLAEAEQLRALGWVGPILLLEGCFAPEDLALCERLNLWHVVHCREQIDWLAMHRGSRAHRVFLKLNTGMNRVGFQPEAYAAAWERLSALPQVGEITHMTHFACADEAGGVDEALARFARGVGDLSGERTLANSAAVLVHGADPRVAADWVRPGIALYGSSPTGLAPDAAHWDLQPAMSLRSELIDLQSIAAGESVGYGARFTAARPMRIGVVACGYADGYPRVAPNGTPVVVDGVRTTLVGRVSMDMITVDLEPVFAAGGQPMIGSPVLLWGQDAQAELCIDEVAASAGTLGYELMCALAARVPVRVE
ncbi:MAG: alanine racemase [Thiomonas sp.]|nr:alanine racemase [Thiomonas sp.]